MPPCLFLRDWCQSGRSTPVKRPFSTVYLQTPATAFHAEPLHQQISPCFLYRSGNVALGRIFACISKNWKGGPSSRGAAARYGYGLQYQLVRLYRRNKSEQSASNAVTAVSGSWTVTGVTGNNNAYAAEWVGIDGYSSPTVEQVGTLQETFRSAPTYYAWYEMYPNSLVEITSLTISPGNTISASVTYNGNGSFALKMTDNTTGKSFSTTQSLPWAAQHSDPRPSGS